MRQNVVFVGNPGAGKSTLLNCVMKANGSGEQTFFKSGVSVGQGMTYQLDEREVNGVMFMDTPGLEDTQMRKQAADAITMALKKEGMYSLFFVVTLESGRVRPADVATVQLVLASVKEIKIYGLIINKLTTPVYKRVANDSNEFLKLAVQLNIGNENSADTPVAIPFFVKKYEDLEDVDNVTTDMPDLIDFVQKVPKLTVHSNMVGDIPSDNTFDAMETKLEEALSQLKKNNADMEERMVEERKRYEQQIHQMSSSEEEQKKREKAASRSGRSHWNDAEGKYRITSNNGPSREGGNYKHTQWGMEGKREVKTNGSWTEQKIASKSDSRESQGKSSKYSDTHRSAAQHVARSAVQGVAVAADKVLLRNGIGYSAVAGVSATATPAIDQHVTEIGGKGKGLKVLAVDANAAVGNAKAGAMITPVGAQASANANGAEASASAALIESVIEANARAVAAEAQAQAGIGLAHLGAYAGASVTTGKVEASITNVPFANASAEGPGAGAEAGVSWKYTGGSAGAHFGEARAGPFGVRAGVKFGAGIRNGVPEVDIGPVTTCSIV